MNRLLSATIWALFLSSCAPPHSPQRAPAPLMLRVDRDMPPWLRALFFSAAEEWRLASGGALYSWFDDSGVVEISTNEHIGTAKCQTSLIQINPNWPIEKLRAFALHEIGHAWHLPHLVDGVMAPNVSAENNCIDSYAIEVACDLYECFDREEETCLR